MATDPSDKHLPAARTRLGHLASLSEKTEATERRILAAAEDRLAAVEKDLATLQPRVHLDVDAGDRYQALTAEKGQLTIVIARARQVLGDAL
jgi:hypothetical protein